MYSIITLWSKWFIRRCITQYKFYSCVWKEIKKRESQSRFRFTKVELLFHNHKIWTSVVYHLSTYEWMRMKAKKVFFTNPCSKFLLPLGSVGKYVEQFRKRQIYSIQICLTKNYYLLLSFWKIAYFIRGIKHV